MTIRQTAVFRANRDPDTASCYWDVYGINESVYAFGESLAEARRDAREAFACHFDVSPEDIILEEYHEHVAYTDPASGTDVWVRTHEDFDPDRMDGRRNIRTNIGKHLDANPDYIATFSAGGSSTGEVIAAVALPDDLLVSLLEQVGGTDRLYVAMPEGPHLYWQCLVTPEAEGFHTGTRPVSDLNLGPEATVADFMEATGAKESRPTDYLLCAA